MSFETVTIRDCTLIRGDCLAVLPTLAVGSVDCAVTDPPYGMSFQSNRRREMQDKIQADDGYEMFDFACQIEAKHSRYVFGRWNNLSRCTPASVITWVKNNWSMGDLNHEHARQTELVLFWPGVQHSWPYSRPTDVVFAPRSGNDLHPAEKSVALMRRVVSWTAGTVFDPFMGVASTGVACVHLGRKFIGIEIEKRYFDIACKRIERAYEDTALLDYGVAVRESQEELFDST